MGYNPSKTVYPFAEIFEVTTSKVADASVDIWDIPAGTIITMVLAKIKTAGVTTGNLIIGDDDDDDGYLIAADACAAVDTIYGDMIEERGRYIAGGVAGTPAGASCSPAWKAYTCAGTVGTPVAKELKIEQSGTLTTAAVIEVFVFGYRYAES